MTTGKRALQSRNGGAGNLEVVVLPHLSYASTAATQSGSSYFGLLILWEIS
jgi:hypothetical protein